MDRLCLGRGWRLSAIIVALVASGCVSTGPKLSRADIDAAERDGRLEALFDQLAAPKAGLAKLSGGDPALLVAAGERLAGKEAVRLTADLEASRLPSGLVPLTAIGDTRARAERIKRWDGRRHLTVTASLDAEQQKTRAAIAAKQAALAKLAADDYRGQLALLREVAGLGGAGSAEETAYHSHETTLKARLHGDGAAAYQARQFPQAERHLSALHGLDPEYKDVRRLLVLARLRGIEEAFREPKGDQEIEAAFQQLLALNQLFALAGLREEAGGVLTDIRGYYLSLAAASVAGDRLVEAYHQFGRARALAGLVGEPAAVPEEAALVDRLRRQVDLAQARELQGLTLGYLSLIEEFQPDYPQLRKYLRETKERLYDRSLKRVATSQFTKGGETFDQLGASVSAKIAQNLFKALPEDIRLVERDQLQAVLREQEILAMQNKAVLNISSADYLVQGGILESSVETDEKKGRKVMRVRVGEKKVANPALQEWLALPESARKVPRPAEFVSQPAMEDVALNVTSHRKVGLLGVSFRLVESSTSKVIYTDSITLKRSADGESSDAAQIGEFVHPFKVAELPSDGEILEALADEAATRISAQLADQLKDQESAYRRLAERFAAEENLPLAADYEGAALVIAEHKRKDIAPYLERLRGYALQARLAE